MIGLGLASSHAPAMFEPVEMWPTVYARIPEYMKASQPQSAKLETPEVISGYLERIEDSFQNLRRQIEDYDPDAIIVLGDDQGDMFNDSINPAFALFTGDSLWGLDGTSYRKLEDRNRVNFTCHSELAKELLKGLVKRGFDIAASATFNPLGRPDHGVSHMVASPIPRLIPNFDVPIIPLFINEYFPPLPTAQRCMDLGRAIADVMSERPERIAIYASGGLSHDPGGPRAGWVDEPLDRWVLERLERNDLDGLSHLFTFDSDTMRSGTGEIRAWLSVAAAMGRPARVHDYIRAHHAKTGLAFASWPAVGSEQSIDQPSRTAVKV